MNIVNTPLTELLPILVRVESQIDGDLSLARLARAAGLSEFHFHRRFRDTVGETPKQYTQRLRLEKAAFALIIEKSSVLEVALDCGFRSHETFSRAFKRHFGCTPSEYRRNGELAGRADEDGRRQLPWEEREYRLSATRPRELDSCHLAFIRHLGPYEDVPDDIFDELLSWAVGRGWQRAPLLLAICHDVPGLTPTDKLRYDAAIRVHRSFIPEGRIGHQILAGGLHALTTHVGHFDTLPTAYLDIAQRVSELEGYRPGGLPTVEVYRTTRVNSDFDLNHTDICIPVQRQAKTGCS